MALMLAAVWGAVLGPVAHANGQTTHIWITRQAVELVADDELQALLADPAVEPMLVHGTMFPDGGYAVGHPYGESAHWEPFQSRYLEWIKAEFEPPYDGEAAAHVAFLMGLGSHGLADQTFDAFYLNRSQLYDGELGWAQGKSMDEATDFKWAQINGAQVVPEQWVPAEVLVSLYAEHGIEVDPGTLTAGQDLLELAVGAVGLSATAGGDLSLYEDAFPWAMANLENDELPGIPDYEAFVVASYWEELWERLHEGRSRTLIDRTWPTDGQGLASVDPESPDARISVIFREGLAAGALTADQFSVVDSGGTEYPVDVWVYYGEDSHIVHLVPQQPWPEQATLQVTVKAGVETRTGATLAEDHTWTVYTYLPLAEDSGQADAPGAEADVGKGEATTRCSCASGGGAGSFAWVWLAAAVAGVRRREQSSTRGSQ